MGEGPILLDVENVNYFSYEISENDRIIFTSYSICENKTIIIIVNARMAFTIHRTRMRPVPPHCYSERQVIFDVHYNSY